jgi:serine/threonine protein phosphatase PrpC
MRPTNNQVRPPAPADPQAEAAPASEPIGRVPFEATMPETLPIPARLVKPSVEPTWRVRLRGLWESLAGSRKVAAMPQDRDLPVEPAPSSANRARTLRVGVVSAVGNYREHNEDNFYLPTLAGKAMGGGIGNRDACMELPIENGLTYTFVVADGMGGQLAGEKASQMAVDIIPKELLKRIDIGEADDRQVQRVIRDAVAAANQEILSLSVVQTEFSNMGTTVVLALFRNDRVYFAGIGDSRAYRIRDGRIEQLTKDHSLAQALLEAGTITAEELPNHKFNHVLYLYLGSKDARGGPEDVKAAEFRAGDRFILASDGLTGVVPDAKLGEVVGASDDPQASAWTLLKLALDNNSKDNITCLVVHAV